MEMRVFGAHLRLRFIQLLKEPGYVVSTLLFPSLFFLIFALPNADTPAKARFLLGSFSAFAVLGVCFFQFGVHNAQEIRTGWHTFSLTLPARRFHMIVAQWLGALVCAFLSALAVYITVELSTELDIEFWRWIKMVAVVMCGSIPYALFSLAASIWVSGWAALPVFNLIYILSSFGGGLWLPPNALPTKIESISQFLPTRHFGEVVWKVALGQDVDAKYLWYWLIFTVLSAAVLLWSLRFSGHRQRI